MIFTDYIFILILGLSTLFGFARGFIRESFTILNLVIAAFATYFSYSFAYDFFAQQVKSATAVQALSILIPFLCFWILMIIVNSFAISSLGGKGKIVDRLMGTAFGILRGAVVVGFVYLTGILITGAQEDKEKMPEWLKSAETLNLAKMSGEVVLDFLPEKIAKCYKFADACTYKEITEDLMKSSVYADTIEKLKSMGFSEQNIKTLSSIYRDLPTDFGTKLSPDEIAAMEDPVLIKDYGKALISDYRRAITAKEVEPSVSNEELDDLLSSLDNLHAPTVPDIQDKTN